MSANEIHPSAIGANVRPTSPSQERTFSSQAVDGHEGLSRNNSSPSAAPEDGYPEQKHAGAVGYGPNYNQKATLSEKITGLKEEIVGKVSKNPSKVEHGRDLRTGDLKRREREQDLSSSAFGGPDAGGELLPEDKHAMERAKSIRPEQL